MINNLSERTYRNTEWKLHYKSINKRNENSYQVKLKFVHSWLPSGKMNVTTKHTYPFWKIIEYSSTPHDHFLPCNQSSRKINNRINHITKILKLLETSEPLVAMIIRGIQLYYLSFSPKPLYQDSEQTNYRLEHQSEIGWKFFIWDRIFKNFKLYIVSHYKVIESKRKSELWAKFVLSNHLKIHIETWKTYCDTIHENNNKKAQISQLYQDKVHEISAIKEEAHELTNEQSKWFSIWDKDVGQMNIQVINR